MYTDICIYIYTCVETHNDQNDDIKHANHENNKNTDNTENHDHSDTNDTNDAEISLGMIRLEIHTYLG